MAHEAPQSAQVTHRVEQEKMAPGDSPAVARRRVRLALRKAREAKDFTQGQVAEAMEWSLSKVMRIESGEVTISPNDLRPLLHYLGVSGRAEIDELIQLARASRRRQEWWDEPHFRGHVTPAMLQLIQYEAMAKAVRHFYSAIVPGRLQTSAYAEAIFNSYREELSEEDIAVRLEVRQRRRDDLLARKDPPKIFLLLDESVLMREIGGPRVLGDQLADLLRLVKEGRLNVRVVPFTAVEAPIPTVGAFEILYLNAEDGGGENAVMYRENQYLDEIVEDSEKIKRHRDIFEKLWNAGQGEEVSVALIEERARSALARARRPASGRMVR
jgi:transcriptional regulator with XRE-family HTH domain